LSSQEHLCVILAEGVLEQCLQDQAVVLEHCHCAQHYFQDNLKTTALDATAFDLEPLTWCSVYLKNIYYVLWECVITCTVMNSITQSWT